MRRGSVGQEGASAPSFSRIPGAGRRRFGKGKLKKEAATRAGRIQVEELSLYDLLFPENLSKQDIQKIKQVAVDFPQKVKARISELDHWTDKQKQTPRLTILIRDMLWNKLLECYDELSIFGCRQKIYEYIYIRYPEIA